VANEDGFLRRVNRETTIRVFAVLPGESATLYELGIPVVVTGDKWHYDIGQKVPLTLDRKTFNRVFCVKSGLRCSTGCTASLRRRT